jgi:small-conductance mechanosensitive channel
MLSVRLTGGLDQLWHRLTARSGLIQLNVRHPPAKVIGEILFWLTILFFIVAAADILELNIFVKWLSELVEYFPSLVAGALIILAGLIIGSLARDLVEAAATTARISQSQLLGKTVYVTILTLAIMIGINQIGIDTTLLLVMVTTILAMTLGGLALAFAMGSRNHVANIIAARELRHHYRPGDTVHISEITGKIIDITGSKIIVDSGTEKVMIPARLFDKEISTLAVHSGRLDESK